jgi:hypothetical protein
LIIKKNPNNKHGIILFFGSVFVSFGRPKTTSILIAGRQIPGQINGN